MTKVIFRKFIGGDVIALFPEIAADRNAAYCLSYMRIGQHGMSSLYPDNTVPASIGEAASLFNELVTIGYENLVVYQRTGRKDYMKRVDMLNFFAVALRFPPLHLCAR